MKKITQLLRGTTEQNNEYVGLEGQLTVDTQKSKLRLHDGQKPGGLVINGEVTANDLSNVFAVDALGALHVYMEKNGIFLNINKIFTIDENCNTRSLVPMVQDGRKSAAGAAVTGGALFYGGYRPWVAEDISETSTGTLRKFNNLGVTLNTGEFAESKTAKHGGANVGGNAQFKTHHRTVTVSPDMVSTATENQTWEGLTYNITGINLGGNGFYVTGKKTILVDSTGTTLNFKTLTNDLGDLLWGEYAAAAAGGKGIYYGGTDYNTGSGPTILNGTNRLQVIDTNTTTLFSNTSLGTSRSGIAGVSLGGSAVFHGGNRHVALDDGFSNTPETMSFLTKISSSGTTLLLEKNLTQGMSGDGDYVSADSHAGVGV